VHLGRSADQRADHRPSGGADCRRQSQEPAGTQQLTPFDDLNWNIAPGRTKGLLRVVARRFSFCRGVADLSLDGDDAGQPCSAQIRRHQ
jgi:hypothetical protein